MEILKNPSSVRLNVRVTGAGFLGSLQRKSLVAEGFFLVHAGAKVRCQMLEKVNK